MTFVPYVGFSVVCCALWALAQPGLRGSEPTQSSALPSPEIAEWFEREVRPLLAERCLSCHSSGLQLPKANLKLDRREFVLAGGDSGPAIVVGQPEESLLFQAVRGEGLQMPPDKPLSQAEQAKLQRWILLGAPWPDSEDSTAATGPDWLIARARTHWAWQPMREHDPPRSSDLDWPARPLDAFVLHKLDSLQLKPNPSAQPVALLRRLAYDLTGLPPSVSQTLDFTAARDSEQAYFRLVERLLASPEFGVTWGRHWLDLVRYCETLGHEFDFPVRHAWRYRDAVIDALNSDVSYARFVSEHIAGDLLPEPRRHPVSDVNQSLALTGWWWMGEGLHAPVDVWGDEATRIDNQIDVYSKAFLGLTVACARCHDHKFDALSAADYTSLVGVLQSSRRTYAYDDPHAIISTHNRSLAEHLQRTSDAGLALLRKEHVDVSSFESWCEQLVVKLRKNIEESRAAFPLHHPLAPLLLLADTKTEAEFSTKRKALAAELATADRAFEAWQANSPKLADFSAGLPSGWYVETPDPLIAKRAVKPLPMLDFDPVGMLPARSETFVSHALGRQQQLSLRSPTFELTHPIVAMRMRGKSAQSSIVVDNYFMNEFQGLLFGDLRKPIDQPSDNGWVVHRGDLNKYLGHPAYVSIEDDENAWFELSEVRLSNTPPPVQPHPLSLQLLSDPSLTADQLRRQMASALHSVWRSAIRPVENLSTHSHSILSRHDHDDSANNDSAINESVDSDSADTATVQEALSRSSAELLRSAVMEGERLQLPLPVARIDRDPLEKMAAKTPVPIRLIAMHEGTPRSAQLAIRGNPHVRGEPVLRGDLQALGGQTFDQPTSSGRSELAASLTSGRHPLLARVIVNRVWLHLLGRGLVDSPDNFGLLGGAPSHAELLDFLALRFMEHDWSIKWLVREICLSRTYRLASPGAPDQIQSDPTARMLSHRQVRRLSAEQLRDSMLAISGSLDRTARGESVPVHLSEQMTGRGRPSSSGPLDAAGRRSAFIEIRRNFLDPFLVAFDQPPPATTVGKRNISNVPAQALSMLNDPLVHELAGRWSARLWTQHSTHEQRVQAMFLAAFARMPSDPELAACLATLDTSQPDDRAAAEARLAELAHVLMCTKEFQYLQ